MTTQQWIRKTVAAIAAIPLLLVGLVPTAASAADGPQAPRTGLLAEYLFSEASGTSVADTSGNAKNGTVQGTESWAGGAMTFSGSNYVKLPDGLLTGKTAATVSVEVAPAAASLSGNVFLWNIGGTGSSAANSGTGQFFVQPATPRAAISKTNYSSEQKATSSTKLTASTWQSVTATIAPNGNGTSTLTFYINGVQVAQNAASTANIADLAVQTNNVIGWSAYSSDSKFQGRISAFRLYDSALSATQVSDISQADAAASASEAVARIAIGDTSNVTANLTLPTADGVTWSTSDAGVVEATGTIHRASTAKTATLTATSTIRGTTSTRDFSVTVASEMSASDKAQADLDAISIPDAGNVRGNITLPATGTSYGSAITWQSSNPAVVSDAETNGIAAGAVSRGASDQSVTLTATVAGTTATRAFALTVTAKPTASTYDAGYLWTRFSATDYEKIYLSYSADGLSWTTLNQKSPILASAVGTKGVRDPHLVRSPDGDKYWIIATDLHAEGTASGGTWDQVNASQYLIVWESTDLVHWSDAKRVYAGFANAGCVWAPEAIWDAASGQYVVYWSARDKTQNGTDSWALRVYKTTTRDFVTFSTPEVWIDDNSVTNAHGQASGQNIIDTTIVQGDDGRYYRFSTSDWYTVVDVADSPSAPTSQWTRLVERDSDVSNGKSILTGDPVITSTAAGLASIEGLTVYQAPSGSWIAMGDHSGYTARTIPKLSDLASGTGFTTATASFDMTFRHGSVLRLSASEQSALQLAYGNDAPVNTEEPQQDPIASYTFDDGTLTDSAPFDGSNDLTAAGTAAVTTDAATGSKVLSLDGTSGGYASFPQGFFDGRNSLTVSMDVRSDLTSGNFFTFAFGKDSTSYYFLRVRGADLRSAITTGSYSNEKAVTGTLSSGAWHTVQIVFDGTTMRVYVDKVLTGTTELGMTVGSLGRNLLGYLGKSFYSGDAAFKGAFDNIKVYNRVLSEDELIGDGPVLASARVGSVPASASVTGTDDHTAVNTLLNKEAKTITSYVRTNTDLAAVPVSLTLNGVTATASIDGAPFASGDTVDLSDGPKTLTVTRGSVTENWTIEKPVVAGNPVLPGQYADPDIDILNGKFWIFPTTDGYSSWSGTLFHAFSSTDLVNWTDEGVILDVNAGSGSSYVKSPWSTGSAWAPTIEEKNGKYYFYYCAKDSSGTSKIGVAWADDPAGPYTVADQPIVSRTTGSVTVGQAIDPAIFTDDDGISYMTYGNGSAAIVQLNADMTSIDASTVRSIGGLTDFRESVQVVKIGGRYHWTWSCDDTGSENYHVNYGVSDSLYQADGSVSVSYKYTLLQKDSSEGILGTAHQSVLVNGDEVYIAYGRFYTPLGFYTSSFGYHREVAIDAVPVSSDGYLLPVTPSNTGVAATVVGGGIAAGAPTIAGTVEVGQTVTVDAGDWAPAQVALSYQWLADGQDIPGATSLSYAIPAASAGATLSVRVTGTKAGVSTSDPVSVSSVSAATAAVRTASLSGDSPRITGTAKVGETLTAEAGSWGPEPVALSYQWYADAAAIPGATGASYTLTDRERGAHIVVTVTGTKTGFTSLALSSAPTDQVVSAAVPAVQSPSVTGNSPRIVGTVRVGSKIRVTGVTWAPSSTRVSYQWYADGAQIRGATKSSLTLAPAQSGKKIVVRLVASAAGYARTVVESRASGLVAKGRIISRSVHVSGTAAVGATLRVTTRQWKPDTVALSYRWYRDGSPIVGATTPSYRLSARDRGAKISLKVTARKPGYSATSTRAALSHRVK